MTNIFTLNYLVNTFESDLKRAEVQLVGNLAKSVENAPAAPDSVVNNILGFARAYDTKKSKSTGYFEMILN